MRKHEIDQANQGLLLLPPEVSLAAGQFEEQPGGVYYPPTEHIPSAEAPAPNGETAPRVTGLALTLRVLDAFARECKARGSVTNAENRLRRVEDFEEPEQALVQRREKSAAALKEVRLAAKLDFAHSLGIEVEVQELPNSDQKLIKRVVAQDPTQQAELDGRYRAFREEYAETANAKRRDRQRVAIRAQLAAPAVAASVA